MSDWLDATDPVPARRELTDAEKKRHQRFRAHMDRVGGWLRAGAQAPSTYHVEPDFEEMGA